MNLLHFWQRAAQEEIGLALSTPAPFLRLLQNKLYEARKGHPELQSITMAMVGGDIWLVKDTVKRLDDAGTPGRTDQESPN